MARALITGVTGQDGSYLAELLLEKGYDIIGVTSGTSDRALIRHLEDRIIWAEGDIKDPAFVRSLIETHAPDEVYNLASVATVANPWDNIRAIVDVTALAPFHFLEAIRASGKPTQFFQASSAEMFGNVTESPQHETTPLCPQNPYGASKVFAHSLIGMYRRDHGLFAVSGILFNHESPRRGHGFITRKVTSSLAAIRAGKGEPLVVGNLDASRDWGYAKEYVEAMWLMLQQDKPDDYVIATGVMHTVRELVETAADALDLNITWEGTGVDEVGKDSAGNVVVRIDPAFYRPAEAVLRVGDASRLRSIGWNPTTSFEDLIGMMAKEDYNRIIAH